MFHHRLDKDASFTAFFNWLLLSFLSGTVNSGGYLACQRFVTHVTGFATLFGIDAAHGNWDRAIGIVSVPAFFLMGVMVSASLVDRQIHNGKRPRYEIVMALVMTCLLLAAVLGSTGSFGRFGADLKLKEDYLLLVLLCAASGLQNAAITTSSGHTVRTTHLTGITTDLGIGIVRALSPDLHHPETHLREVRANWLRLGTIVVFMFGSAVGAILFLQVGYIGFLLPAAIALYAMIIALKTKHFSSEKKPAR